jgi:hypothetical protein
MLRGWRGGGTKQALVEHLVRDEGCRFMSCRSKCSQRRALVTHFAPHLALGLAPRGRRRYLRTAEESTIVRVSLRRFSISDHPVIGRRSAN